MPRDGSKARARLRDAALDLYEARGYDATTAAQIAERAGVTERTYFRHFPDKREVLFDGDDEFLALLAAAVAAAPGDVAPLAALERGFVAGVPMVVANRPVAERRARVIGATPALQERAHAKLAAVGDALAAALERRGVAPDAARLAAQVGLAAYEHAARAWDGDPSGDLAASIRRSFAALAALG
jgi:AcrR family transcriptional regulator